MELSAIRANLKEIRYYYTRKAMFDEAVKIVGGNNIMEKAERYNEAIRFAPPLLYDLYVGLYIKGFTQEAFSVELGYTPEYVQMLHKKLLLFLQKQMKE